MVLRCSLLGHNYGEPEVDREREERGSEVVLTVTEFEACQRCGERNVISENTEVTSIGPGGASTRAPDGADSSADQAGSAPGSSSTDRDAGSNPGPTAVGSADGRAEPTAAGPTTSAASSGEETEAAAASDDEELEVPTDENGDPIVDDGEILEDDGTDANAGDRRHGEWPDSEDVGPPVETSDEPTAWPDDEQDSGEADDADGFEDRSAAVEDQPEDDAVILESGSDSSSDSGSTTTETGKQFDYSVDSTGGSDTNSEETPEAVTGVNTVRPDSERESAPAESTRPETGIASAQSAPAPGEGSPTDGSSTEFYCPQCSFVAPGDSGSLRTGDICPECKKGYLGERSA
ncbi:hypothetical protein HALLA_17880 [Halostagnicola larsenii XH-48]|uniref:Uncharacterized protein n=1 Tax=Halostagnicola larsenii XH-48 TaxID=797299 RepID=W0JSW7_9EURY|nr:hypothetical protein [Halostagnicola larsenii]AHG00387.1 hypothetical protein HALLA_17880 [Halostagnicola larsenii XH-48]